MAERRASGALGPRFGARMLLEATSEIASRVTGAIRNAARATGANFEYLLKTAQRESNLNPSAKARTSSATGLFQFIDQTWLQTLKRSGHTLGYGRYADNIAQTSSGRYVVTDPAQRREIMRLRTDPMAASAMAGAFTQRNAELLAEGIGRAPTDGELYIAHFLGPSGAVQLINTAEENPKTNAAALFPKAARANRSIFYGKGGPRSAAEVYAQLVSKHQNTRTPPGIVAPTQIAGAPVPAAAQVAAVSAVNEPARTGHAQAYAAETGPVFHGLFRTEPGAPVSAVVTELWTPKTARKAQPGTPVQPSAAAERATAPAGRPVELFHFLRPEIRAQAPRQA